MTQPYIQTVLGPVPADSIGFTLPHEHTYCKLWLLWERHDPTYQFLDEATFVEELSDFKAQGGSCVVDVTTVGFGRNPTGLARLSQQTGLAIVMGCGWYREPYYPAEDLIDRRMVDDLAEQLIREFHDGVADTGIRPGIIGEIGAEKSWITAQEERVCRAAARAARATGLAITTHSYLSDVGLSQLKIFEEEGVDLRRVVIGHVHSYPFLDYCLNIIERGSCVEFDTLGYNNPVDIHMESRIIRLLLDLLDRGHADQILLSQDICKAEHLRTFGGNGYSYIARVFVPRLREAGVSEEAIDTMTTANPRRILQIGG